MSEAVAYVLRHGATRLSPTTEEGWKQLPLSPQGRADASAAAQFLKDLPDDWPQPTHIISSDLNRAIQTAKIVGTELNLHRTVDPQLRAFDSKFERPARYMARSGAALHTILADPGIPLVVGHRSFTSFLSKHFFDSDDDPTFSESLISEGGVVAITSSTLAPLFRAIPENWPANIISGARI